MIFIIIEYFDFMILNQPMALFIPWPKTISKNTVTFLTTNKSKTHFFQKFNDSFQIMNWIITQKIYKKVEFFPLFFLPKRKFFHEKNLFFKKKIKNLEVRSFLKKLKSHGQNQKVSQRILKKSIMSSFQNQIFKGNHQFSSTFLSTEIMLKNFLFSKKLRKIWFSKVIQEFDFWENVSKMMENSLNFISKIILISFKNVMYKIIDVFSS